MLRQLFSQEATRREALAIAMVVPEPARCVQCGICTFTCPLAIDVRRHVIFGQPVRASECVSCGQCVMRCPRGAISLERIPGLA